MISFLTRLLQPFRSWLMLSKNDDSPNGYLKNPLGCE